MATLGEQWDALCDEFSDAQQHDRQCWAKVNKAFADVYAGTGPNPSETDLAEWNAARARLDSVKKRMDEFVKANA